MIPAEERGEWGAQAEGHSRQEGGGRRVSSSEGVPIPLPQWLQPGIPGIKKKKSL